jgi:hypothetical protein
VNAAGVGDDRHHAARFIGIKDIADAGEDLFVEIDRIHHR